MCHVNTGSLPPVCQVRMSGPPTVKLWVVTGREGELLCCAHTATPHLLVFLRMNWNKKLLAAAITPESAARHRQRSSRMKYFVILVLGLPGFFLRRWIVERIPVRMAVSLPSSFCLISFPFRRHPLHGLNLVLVFLFLFF